ncbi:ATP-binding protein [Flavitalea sp.]|nr:ATP-binding protein [Flavitalea sp.]
MRFLNKVFFINSATIPFAEVMLDGNVHLIGTQGVGKSTLLRAVLFFYNADTIKLGISKEKKSFADYYFPFRNSYVVYEVMRENGAYCILAFKSQGKVCFRFIDTAFDRKYFVSGDGVAFEKWEDIRQMLDAGKIFYFNKIDRYEEYRNILYGNPETTKKDLIRFSLLQSKQYQNIPRTIQNVFLNSKLDAEFIKQTIIMSLNEDDIVIDLASYTHHLKNFERQLSDIYRYKQPAVRKTAEEAVNRLLAVRHHEKEKNQLSLQLAWSAAETKRKLPRLQTAYNSSLSEREILNQSASAAATRFQNKSVKIRDEISAIEHDLKKAKEKADHYNKVNIEHLLELAASKPTLEARLNELSVERQLLTSKHGEITQKYEAIDQALQNSLMQTEHEIAKERLAIIEQVFNEENTARKFFEDLAVQLRSNTAVAIAQAREKIRDQQQSLTEIKLERESARHRNYYESEKRLVSQQIQDLQLSIRFGEQELIHLANQQETLKKQWEIEDTGIKLETGNILDKLQAKVDTLKMQLKETESKLNDDHSFYSWLNTNVSGWQNNIGKVCTEKVLFDRSLEPSLNTLSEGDATSLEKDFFGVKINLGEIDFQVKTLAELEEEKESLKIKFAEQQQNFQLAQQENKDQLDKLRKKFQPQIKSLKDAAIECRYKLDRESDQLQQAQLFSKELELKAVREKDQVLSKLEEKIASATDVLTASDFELSSIETELTKQIRTKEKEHHKRVGLIREAKAVQENKMEERRVEVRKNYQDQHDELLLRQKQELRGKGVDTGRLSEIDNLAEPLQRDLALIEKNRDIVTEYRKDKREFIDKADDFKMLKASFEKQHETELKKFNYQKTIYETTLADLDKRTEDLKDELRESADNITAFNNFTVSDAYAGIDPVYKEEKDIYRNERVCRALIDLINESIYIAINKLDELKENINKFSGNFSPDNIFNFKTTFTSKQDYTEFADHLNEFVHNSKIEEFEKRVNERFASIINTVGNQTGSLMSKAGEIQRVITAINNDFQNKNFVGAIRKIELKLDESSNRVVQLLLEIKKFNDDHSFDLGGMNLFSTSDQFNKNQKAADLLRHFGKAITEYKLDAISLSDSFELKFRIEENDNDTGWVEKLSNVGSEGTDVLVKAMINIMLLNVFKDAASRKFKDFRLHCMMDEIGKLHPNNVRGILQFANDRNINLINGSPTENNPLDYRHIYKLEKDINRHTRIKRIISKTDR